MDLYYKDKKKINFSKMHGLSNDFMVINCIEENFILSSCIIKQLSDRYTGIGFDQLLLIEKSNNALFDFNYRIFNANGNEVEQCGNGARCFGLFLLLKGLTNKKKILVSTKKKPLIIEFLPKNIIKVDMNEPDFTFHNLSSLKNILYKNFSIKLFRGNLICSLVSIGNPHCIIKVQCIKNAPVKIIGENIGKNPIFPEGINVSFVEIINKNSIKLRVYERDVGETKACGSAACAAVAMGIAQKLLSDVVEVELLGGKLTIIWKGFGNPLYMIGPATHVYDGFIYI
ncbi:diaminopimelate epimerase [Buchnera aphidicola str. Ak (Acyrthosiphon kondoi)]|uniref:Diaminopimelate epimerase n=1 Tax=Buchnera aphidicola str. Ak (Acyrthosiphon kondoi) TaxID=1005090 RepID=G2LM71_9GAMM|nr:diaminopimelate epimerase [Buchnera aphidicola]AEO08918.1 diaminopimelate epimerase [Buchnera aphidicola str. Ak (Acyrthosiphon kondoi)]